MDQAAVKTIIEAGRAIGGVQSPTTSTDFVVVPNGYGVVALEQHLERYRDRPARVRAVVRMASVASFIDYMEQFITEDSRVFVTMPAGGGTPVVTGILDYHASGVTAAWCEHRAVFECVPTEEWKRLMGTNAKRMSQVEFATWLEENAEMVVAPPGGELLDLVQTLYAKQDVHCDSLVRLNNGRQCLNYNEQVELRGAVTNKAGAIEFPTLMELAVAPFEGEAAYRMKARLRYRIENRRLQFWYELVNVHLIVKDVVGSMVQRIASELEVEPWFGEPPK